MDNNNQIAAVSQLLHMTLSANTALVALVGDKIRGSHQWDAEAGSFGTPCLIIDVSGRRGGYGGRHQHVAFELYAYSKLSKIDAVALYDVAYTALHGVRLYDPAGTIAQAGYARESEGQIAGWNDKLQAWFSRGIWRANVAG